MEEYGLVQQQLLKILRAGSGSRALESSSRSTAFSGAVVVAYGATAQVVAEALATDGRLRMAKAITLGGCAIEPRGHVGFDSLSAICHDL